MTKPTEEIKDKLDIVEFLKGYLDLRPAGKNFKANCPFHKEKTPSFIVNPERQIWHCFGCGEGGDIFKFLMRYENLEFYEALQVLAEKAGVELKRMGLAEQRQFGILYDINSAAAEYFEKALKNSPKAKEYLKGRGLTGETAKDFMVGYAPNGKDELTVELVNRGFSMADLVRAGLTIRTERGGHLDRFRGRVMFPIHNHFGKVIGFSGRILPEFDTGDMGKYINSPDTPIFNKSRVLYGFWQSKRPIVESERALMVEGQMDFLMAWQDGVYNVVATSGTALTPEHLRSLRRVTNKLVLAFDSDEAGFAAAERAIDMAGGSDFSVALLELGEYGDPADAVVEDPGFLAKALEKAKPAMDYYFERYLTKDALMDMEKRKAGVRVLLSKIRMLWSSLDRAHYIHELSDRARIPEKDLQEEADKLFAKEGRKELPRDQATEENQPKDITRQDMIAERILTLIAVQKSLYKDMESYREYLSPRYQRIFGVLAGEMSPDTDMQGTIDHITLQSSMLFDGFSEEKLKEELVGLSKELAMGHFKAKREALGWEITEAERKGDNVALSERLKEFDDILKKMQNM